MDRKAKKERNNNTWEGLLREGRGICVKTFYCLLYKMAGERDQLLLEHSPGKHLVWKLVPHLLDCSQLWIKEGNWCSAAEWGECPLHSDLYCHGKTPTDIFMPQPPLQALLHGKFKTQQQEILYGNLCRIPSPHFSSTTLCFPLTAYLQPCPSKMVQSCLCHSVRSAHSAARYNTAVRWLFKYSGDVLVLTGIELIFFLVSGTVCFDLLWE